MTDFKDRRKHVRIYRNFILSYHEKDKPQVKYDISQVNNISRGGMSFIAVRSFEKGVALGIELRTPFITEHVYLEGVVLESKEKISNLIYEIRMEFTSPSAEAAIVLDRIERHYSKQSEES